MIFYKIRYNIIDECNIYNINRGEVNGIHNYIYNYIHNNHIFNNDNWIYYQLYTDCKTERFGCTTAKNEWQIEKLAEIAADILDMIKDYELLIAKVDIDARMLGERKKKVNDTIICYGTENVVKIWSYYNHLIYQGLDDKVGVGSVQIIAPLVLLIMQIKYDATDIKTSPKVWYVGFTSQEMLKTEFYNKSIVEINRIVDLLDLPSFF